MANEIQVTYTSGEVLYVTIHQEVDGYVWDPVDQDFQNVKDINSEIPVTEVASSGLYLGNFDSNITGLGRYIIQAWNDADDSNIGASYVYWDGIQAITQVEYDLTTIPVTDDAVTGVAGNLKEALVQLWRRFFKRVTKNSSVIKTYQDNNTTVNTTQDYTEGATDAVEAAE